ncbi:hypothetical protein ABZ297_02590 [Nonomuraea sp. NPDC005983]|uniref:hypothetical protein n=1 Tax=Nonomuraea sp. NPDC005983 TaxID=3155595 RepID=UPI0033B6BBCA
MSRGTKIVASLLAAAVLPGCSALLPHPAPPSAAPSSAPSPTTSTAAPAIDAAGAQRQLETYVDLNNKANKARDGERLKAYEAGSSLLIDQASYRSSKILYPKQRSYTPFGYTDATFHTPAGQPWFAADVVSTNLVTKKPSKVRTLLLFRKGEDGWRQVYSPYALEAKPFLGLAKDGSGQAVARSLTDGSGLLSSPAEFVKLYARQLAGKTPTEQQRLFADDAWVKDAVAERVRMSQYAKVSTTVRPAPDYPSYALRTAAGGALVLSTLSRTVRFDVKPGMNVFHSKEGLLKGEFYRFMQRRELIQIVAHIPAKSAQNGKFRLVAAYGGIVEGSGR